MPMTSWPRKTGMRSSTSRGNRVRCGLPPICCASAVPPSSSSRRSAPTVTPIPGADETAALLPARRATSWKHANLRRGEGRVAADMCSRHSGRRGHSSSGGSEVAGDCSIDRDTAATFRGAGDREWRRADPDAPNLNDAGHRRSRPRECGSFMGPATGSPVVFNATGLRSRCLSTSGWRAGWPALGPDRGGRHDWLQAHGVKPCPDLVPCVVAAAAKYAGFSARDSSAARANGLVTRPLQETLADVLAWELGRPSSTVRQAGLTEDEERALLREVAPMS